MSGDRLTPPQRRILRALAGLTPPWTLTEPFGAVEPPQCAEILGAVIALDSKHEILVSKLNALLGRSELRDLVDVQALLDAGCDLPAALRDAPKKDAGFSPLTLAWVLRGFDPRPLARALGWSDAEADPIEAFRQRLIGLITEGAVPE